MESRAAVFTSQPQEVEVDRGGTWMPGSMLGWRHDDIGGCQVRVRLASAAEEIWTGLESVRLPERHLAVAPQPVGSAGGRHEASSSARSDSARPDALELTITRGFRAIRDAIPPSGRAAHPAGRRRAPDTAELPAVGAALSVVRGGRHRAPVPDVPPASTRSGRHRAADTGVWPVVTDPDVTSEMSRVRVERSDRGARQGAAGKVVLPLTPQPDLLTRPMRLADAVPQRRSGRPHDARGGR